MKDKKRTVRQAFVDSIPVMAGYVVLGIGFGIIMEKSGYNFLWALAMSLFIYAGSMQYASISLLTGGASLITTALMTLMINARHFFYGISMMGKYREIGKGKSFLIFALTDETYSLVCTDLHKEEWFDRKLYYITLSLFNYMYVVIPSGIGGIIGKFMTFDTTGIDFAMTALFVVIFIEQWLTSKNHTSAIIGLVSALTCLLIFGPNRFLIPTMIMITALLMIFRKKLEVTK